MARGLQEFAFARSSLFALLMGYVAATDTVASGAIEIEGDFDELQKMIDLFTLRPAEQQARDAETSPREPAS